MSGHGARILLVDDEAQLIRALRPALDAAGYVVDTGATAAQALASIESHAYGAIILDLGLPDLDGKEVIRRVRLRSDVPILVLSARDIEEEKVEALDAGANDFINKPFMINELTARLRAAMRGRERRVSNPDHIRIGELVIDVLAKKAALEGVDLRLTRREYDLLTLLARHAGETLTHRQMIAAVWGEHSRADAQTVRVLVSQLRQKIEEAPSRPVLLLTEPGFGYRLAAEVES